MQGQLGVMLHCHNHLWAVDGQLLERVDSDKNIADKGLWMGCERDNNNNDNRPYQQSLFVSVGQSVINVHRCCPCRSECSAH